MGMSSYHMSGASHYGLLQKIDGMYTLRASCNSLLLEDLSLLIHYLPKFLPTYLNTCLPIHLSTVCIRSSYHQQDSVAALRYCEDSLLRIEQHNDRCGHQGG